MKRRSLLGVFVAACLAIPLHALSEPPAPDSATGMVARIFDALEDSKQRDVTPSLMARIFDALEDSKQRDVTPSLMARIFEELDDLRAKALEVVDTASEHEAGAQTTADDRRG